MAAIRTGLSEQTGTARPAVPTRARRVARSEVDSPYLNRELAWLEFNARVLFEARDERNPLLERVKFLSIFAGNLDEFFQVRVAGLRQQVEAGKAARSPDGRTAEEQLAAARSRVLELVGEHSAIYVDVRRSLAAEGIELVEYAAIPEHHEALRQRFLDEIFPVLTPLAVDPGHPFPYISTLSLSIAVGSVMFLVPATPLSSSSALLWSSTIICANFLTSSDIAFCSASLPSSTSAMLA